MDKKQLYKLGQYCRYFRREVLKMTLQEVQGDLSLKGISHFEHGRSTNLVHISRYLKACNVESQKREFMDNIEKLLDS